MILVTVGTHHQPFDRLVSAAAGLGLPGERVVVQRGTSLVEPKGCEWVDAVASDVLAAWIAEARVVVTHGGPATVTAVWALGRIPVVVPRRPELREHVDDHQRRWAATVSAHVIVVEDASQLAALVAAPPTRVVPRVAAPELFAKRFGELVDRVVQGRRSRGPQLTR